MSDSQEPEHIRVAKLVDKAIDTLMEHCTSVHVFAMIPYDASKDVDNKDDYTSSYMVSTGKGNLCERYGFIRKWLVRQDAIEAHRATKEDDRDNES